MMDEGREVPHRRLGGGDDDSLQTLQTPHPEQPDKIDPLHFSTTTIIYR